MNNTPVERGTLDLPCQECKMLEKRIAIQQKTIQHLRKLVDAYDTTFRELARSIDKRHA
jgi:hypothetical protein